MLCSDGPQMRGFMVSGHAGAGEHGNDLVCAAISFLATTCANALESVAGAGPEVEQADGYLKVWLPAARMNAEASVILRTFRQGAMDLRQTYPQNIRLVSRAQEEMEDNHDQAQSAAIRP